MFLILNGFIFERQNQIFILFDFKETQYFDLDDIPHSRCDIITQLNYILNNLFCR
jgi:hypothetical protein